MFTSDSKCIARDVQAQVAIITTDWIRTAGFCRAALNEGATQQRSQDGPAVLSQKVVDAGLTWKVDQRRD